MIKLLCRPAECRLYSSGTVFICTFDLSITLSFVTTPLTKVMGIFRFYGQTVAPV